MLCGFSHTRRLQSIMDAKQYEDFIELMNKDIYSLSNLCEPLSVYCQSNIDKSRNDATRSKEDNPIGINTWALADQSVS